VPLLFRTRVVGNERARVDRVTSITIAHDVASHYSQTSESVERDIRL